jgi:hypothetical protein
VNQKAESKDKTEDSSKENNAMGKIASKIYKLLFDGTSAAWTAIFTGVLTLFTFFVYQVAERTDETTRSSQRAFVVFDKIQPKARFNSSTVGFDGWQIAAVWQNAGTTPATSVYEYFLMEALGRNPMTRNLWGI